MMQFSAEKRIRSIQNTSTSWLFECVFDESCPLTLLLDHQRVLISYDLYATIVPDDINATRKVRSSESEEGWICDRKGLTRKYFGESNSTIHSILDMNSIQTNSFCCRERLQSSVEFIIVVMVVFNMNVWYGNVKFENNL